MHRQELIQWKDLSRSVAPRVCGRPHWLPVR
jgi:hypothetical protein